MSDENSHTSRTSTPDLTGPISELEEMHKVAESDLVKLAIPTIIFSCIDKLRLPELNNSETNPTENLQDNGATSPFLTQPYPPHSPLEDASVAPTAPPPHPSVKASDADLQLQE